uniref:Putative TetR regulatory protein n=1 Tax=Mycolicibacterium brisbanense TaxID=146020 RepID=B8R4J9_9MYCO|nr:putative TetR regulatory protein [Mycolicibacterium brisbanense]
MAEPGGDAAPVTDGRTLRWEGRRSDLTRAAVDYVLDTGIADLTLRPLGAAIGVSNTTLIRQFGSKDDIIRDVCQEIHAEMVEALDQFWSRSKGRPTDVLRALWNLWLAPEYARQFTFLFELYGLALRQPERFEWFATGVVYDWLKPLEAALVNDGMEEARARTISTLIMGVVRGLYLDMAGTGDVERASAAFELAMVLIEPVAEARRVPDWPVDRDTSHQGARSAQLRRRTIAGWVSDAAPRKRARALRRPRAVR